MTNQQKVTSAFCGILFAISGIENSKKAKEYTNRLIKINERYGDNYSLADDELAEFEELKNEILGIIKRVNTPVLTANIEQEIEDLPF